MLKILSAAQMRALDLQTMQIQKLSSVELMLRAATKAFEWIERNIGLKEKFVVVCGSGNNGGDGLVIARLLGEKGGEVQCVVLDWIEKKSPDFVANLKLATNAEVIRVKEVKDFQKIDLHGKVVVDAIFGYGLNRPATGAFGELITWLNKASPKRVISIDIPSGMFCDVLNSKEDAVIQADNTLTFHSPKFSFFFPEFGNAPGKIEVLDIGLDREHADSFPNQNYFLTKESVSEILKKRKTFTNKGTFGHAGLIAGSRGKMGAAVLMATAATYAGAGLTTAIVPHIGLNVLQTRIPTAMCEDRFGTDFLEGEITIDPKMTYGIGSGIGKHPKTVEVVRSFLKQVKTPIVCDADALNILSENPGLLSELPENSILTPHIKEFDRLAGANKSSFERFEKLKAFAKEYHVIVVLKDARTIIATPEGDCFFSLNGTPGMATGGSGDVLAGLLTGLLAQAISPINTAKLGVILHGVAGELAAERYTEYRMSALEILEMIGESFQVILAAKV